MQKLSKKKLIHCYEMMVRIRKVEEKLMEVFSAGEIPGFIQFDVVWFDGLDSRWNGNFSRGCGTAPTVTTSS